LSFAFNGLNHSERIKDSVKLSGITNYRKLNFKCHVDHIKCRKKIGKIKALMRVTFIRPFLTFKTYQYW